MCRWLAPAVVGDNADSLRPLPDSVPSPSAGKSRPKADGRFFFKADEQADERYATRLRAFETVLSRVWQSRKA